MASGLTYTFRLDGYGAQAYRPTHVTAKFSETGKLLNPRAIASSSMFGWGPWQTSRKVKCSYGDCWQVSTAGHGGYILVATQEYGIFDRELEAKWLVRSLKDGPVERLYVYQFEEDCAWSKLLYADPVALADTVKYWSRYVGYTETVDEYLNEYVIPSLNRWSPGFKEHVDALNAILAHARTARDSRYLTK